MAAAFARARAGGAVPYFVSSDYFPASGLVACKHGWKVMRHAAGTVVVGAATTAVVVGVVVASMLVVLVVSSE